MTTSANALLEGIRVVEVSVYIAGPVAGMILADLGADVVKIERPTAPDPTRSVVYGQGLNVVSEDGRHMLWETYNRNKRAIAVDLRAESGRGILYELVRDADVFVTNLRISSLRKLGADFDALREVNPRIVYALAEGLGSSGPRANDPTMDSIGMAYSGFMDAVSPDGERPHYPLGGLSDVQTGTNVAFAAVLGLFARDRTGEAQFMHASQVQSLMWLQSYWLAVTANLGRNFSSPGNVSPFLAIYRCRDDSWLAISFLNVGVDWPHVIDLFGFDDVGSELGDALSRPVSELGEMLKDPHSQDELNQRAEAVLARGFATRDRDEWLDLLRDAGIPAGPVQTVEDVLEDEHVIEEGYIVELDNGLRLAKSPIGVGSIPLRGAPTLGQHTEEVLRALGRTDEQIRILIDDGIVK
jgi:crotonobetainyl-CoA:carnitine CoA-transferase CaiB-like acyl-CoA transferase